MYGQAMTKKVQDLLLTATVSNEHLRRLHGKVLRRPTVLAQPSISHEGRGPGSVYEGQLQVESRVPQLEKEVTEAMRKLAELTKKRNVLANQEKKVPQLEAEVEDLRHSIALQCSVHQAEVEGLYAAHKFKVEKLCSGARTERLLL